MEALAPMLGALGLLGVIAALVLGTVVLLVLPLWAILHCLLSDRPGGLKAFVVIALVLTWGLGAVCYGLFASGSRAFRVVTVVSVLLPVVVLVPGVVGLTTGAAIHARGVEAREAAALDAAIEAFRPGPLEGTPADPFVAVRFTPAGVSGAATLATFEAGAIDADTARAVDPRVRDVAREPATGRTFAVTDHAFGAIVPSTGSFTAVEADPKIGSPSWYRGVAFDGDRERVVILTSHVETRFYAYDPSTSDWEALPATYRDLPLVGLVHAPDDGSLYALERRPGETTLRRLHRFNADGASLGTVSLDPPVPWTARDDRIQLAWADGHVVVLLPEGTPPAGDGPAVLYVDRTRGTVRIPGA